MCGIFSVVILNVKLIDIWLI